MKAKKIKMKAGYNASYNLLEIDEIFLSSYQINGFYKKEVLYDYLMSATDSIQVDIYPYPYLIPALSIKNEKYVKSVANSSTHDNLLSLPRV